MFPVAILLDGIKNHNTKYINQCAELRQSITHLLLLQFSCNLQKREREEEKATPLDIKFSASSCPHITSNRSLTDDSSAQRALIYCVLLGLPCQWKCPHGAHLQVVGMLQFMSDINQPSLPTPFYSVLVSISVFMALSTVFHSINSPNNSPFSHTVPLVLSLPHWLCLCESLLQPWCNP